MNTTQQRHPPAIRRGTVLLVCLAALLCLTLVWLNFRNRSAQQTPSDSTTGTPLADAGPTAKPPAVSQFSKRLSAAATGSAGATEPLVASEPAAVPLRSSAAGAATPVWSGAQPSAAARELITRLLRTDDASASPSAEWAAEWTRNLQQLSQQGAPGVAAIREMLATGLDRDFGDWGKAHLGFATTRLAFLDVLAKAGTSDARTVLSEALQTTLEPVEIGTVLRNLETVAPGEYREHALDAARQALAAALPNRDMAAAFEVLSQYGGPEAASELSQLSSKYLYYSAMALAQMPNDAGVPALIAMARGEGAPDFGGSLVALQMLTALATENSAARDVLLDHVRTDRFASGGWPFIVSVLEGGQFRFENSVLDPQPALANGGDGYHAHLVPGNQSYFQVVDGAALTPDWTSRQLALIEALLAVAPSGSAAEQLQQVREKIQARQRPAGGP